MGFWNFGKGNRCIHCGVKLNKGDTFCVKCGVPQEGGIISCTNSTCGKDIPANAEFCPHCGREVTARVTPSFKQGGVWKRSSEEFAIRIDDVDLKGIFSKVQTVEPGTRIILIVNGKYVGELPSGQYDLGGIKSRVANLDFDRRATIIIIDEGDIGIYFDVSNLRTKDDLLIDMRLRVTFRIEQPFVFFKNLMKDRKVYKLEDLQNYLSELVKGTLNSIARSYDYEELVMMDSRKLKGIEDDIRAVLHQDLTASGISLIQVGAVNVTSEEMLSLVEAQHQRRLRMKELQAQAEDQDLDAAEAGLELRANEIVLDHIRGLKAQQRAKEEIEVEDREKRVELLDRMRRADNLDRMSLMRSDDDFDKFRVEIDKGKLLRDEEWRELQEGFQQNREDRMAARKFMMEKLDTMRQQELEIIRDDFRRRMEERKNEDELQALIRDLNRKGYLRKHERDEWEMDVMKKIQMAKEQHLANLQIGEQTAESELRIKRLKAELEHYEDMLDLKTMQFMREQQMTSKRELAAIAREETNFQAKLAREEKMLEHSQHMEETRTGQDFELRRMEQMGLLTPEALIALAPEGRGQVIAELKKTEAFGNMTEEQILAQAAAGSPEVAMAFQERFKAQGGADKERYFQMVLEAKDAQIAQLQSFVDNVQAASQVSLDRVQEMFSTAVSAGRTADQRHIRTVEEHAQQKADRDEKNLDRHENISIAQATGKGKASGGGGSSAEGETRTCPKCGRFMETGWTICPYCGKEF